MSNELTDRGLLLVVSSPSGAGKTTLCHRLMAEFPEVMFSVSYTTRPIRRGEKDGVDYHFVDHATFDGMVEKGEFAEWANVHGNKYGTTVATVREALEGGRHVLFDIDYQGARQLKARFEAEAVLVFVLPPSLEELEERLRKRATDAPEAIERRLINAQEEFNVLKQYGLYQYLVVNDDLLRAYDKLRAIYVASLCAIDRMGQVAEELIRQTESRQLTADGRPPFDTGGAKR
jgi:guanylate kinase